MLPLSLRKLTHWHWCAQFSPHWYISSPCALVCLTNPSGLLFLWHVPVFVPGKYQIIWLRWYFYGSKQTEVFPLEHPSSWENVPDILRACFI